MASSDFERLNQQIEKLSSSIEKLEGKVLTLKGELESGHWGTTQLKEFEVELTKVAQKLESQRSKRQGLIDDRDLAPINSVLKAIQTLEGNIGTLREVQTGLKNAGREGTQEFERISTQIKNADNALKSFQSRLYTKFTPSGKPITEEYTREQSRPYDIGSIESRLGAQRVSEVPKSVTSTEPLASSIMAEKEKQLAANKKLTKAEEKAALEAEKLATLREKIANDPRYAGALRLAQQRGLGIQDLRRAEDRGGNIQSLQFNKDSGGIDNAFRTFVNTTTGKATPGVTGQYRSFTQGIVKDIGELTKWSIALAAIYGPLNKLQELVGDMIENQSKLADAVVATNTEFLDQSKIFELSADAAKASGEAVTGVIDAFTQAYRAAGRYNTQAERQAKATKLLGDSLILSKISTLDQAQAIDTLTAALLQNDRELDKGQELINKWVRVSQVAYVGIDTLATGVAVLGDAAETVGLDIDSLNGLIAVLAETSISGSKEAANTAKALVGAYQSNEAESELNKFGVALRKTNGEVRDFLDIYTQLADLRKQGILTEPDVSGLALALGGGGVRRAKDASALINNVDRLQKIAAESAAVGEDSSLAQDALAKKLDTVQTALTRVENAFQSLAQTLGTDGGLLDLIQGIANGFSSVVELADKLFSVLGKSGPALAAFGAAALAIKKGYSDSSLLLASLGFSGGAFYKGGQFIPGGGRAPAGGAAIGGGYGGGIGGLGRGLLGDTLTLRNYRGAGIAGLLGAGIPTLSNLSEGKTAEAGGNAVGGAVGAAIGALSGPAGLAAGAAIGAAIGESFVNYVKINADDFPKLFTPPELVNTGKPEFFPTADNKQPATQEEQLRQVYEAIGGGNAIAGIIKAELFKASAGSQAAYGFGANFSDRESSAYFLLQQQNPQLYNQLQLQNPNRTRETSPEETQRANAQIAKLRQAAESERRNQLTRLTSGEITGTQYKNISEGLSGYAASAYQDIEKFGKAFIALNDDVKNTSDAYEAYLYLTVNGSKEQLDYLSSIRSEIEQLQELYDNFDATVGVEGFSTNVAGQTLQFGGEGGLGRNEIPKIIADLVSQGGGILSSGFNQARKADLNLPGIAGNIAQPQPLKDAQLVYQEGIRLQQEYLNSLSLTIEEQDQYTSEIEAYATRVKDGGDTFYETFEGLASQFRDAAQKNLEEAGKITGTGGSGIGLQQLDFTRAQLESAAARSRQLGSQWQQQFGYDYKPTTDVVIDSSGLAQPLQADFKIMQILLQELVDQGQKMLDGQYNIPEGATFWVPLTAAYYRNKETAGGLGGGLSTGAGGAEVNSNTQALNRNTQALQNFSQHLLSREVGGPIDKNTGRYPGRTGSGVGTGISSDIPASKDALSSLYPSNGISKDIRRSKDAIDQLYPSNRTARSYPGFGGGSTEYLNDLKQLFSELLGTLRSSGPLGFRGEGGGHSGDVNTNPVARVDLKIDSNTQLVVDGRTLANVIKPYLAEDLIKAQQAGGTITRRFVV